MNTELRNEGAAMSRIMELAQLYRLAGSASVDEHLGNLQVEVTRMEAELEEEKTTVLILSRENARFLATIDELRTKLATLETLEAEREKQEPYAFEVETEYDTRLCLTIPQMRNVHVRKNLYLSAGAPQVPMTELEIDKIANSILTLNPVIWWRKLARAIEAHHKIGANHE
jgi:regulator of replication initiation timing